VRLRLLPIMLFMAGCAAPSPTVAPANPQLGCPAITPPGALDCKAALAVAIAALPQGDQPITAKFEYGTYCALSSGCGLGQASRTNFGLVTFTYPGGGRREYVYVVADATGQPRLGGTLSSSPPPFMSVPTPIP
jgi:hypothetical protein